MEIEKILKKLVKLSGQDDSLAIEIEVDDLLIRFGEPREAKEFRSAEQVMEQQHRDHEVRMLATQLYTWFWDEVGGSHYRYAEGYDGEWVNKAGGLVNPVPESMDDEE